MSEVLTIKNMRAEVGTFALQDICLQVKAGTIMGLVGRNGAGKTTLVKAILGLVPRQRGEILFWGQRMSANPEEIKGRIGVVFDNHIYPPHYKAGGVKKFLAPLYPRFDTQVFDQLMTRFELNPSQRLREYSKGMQMKFSLAVTLAQNPDLVILDEPTAGLDPAARAEILDLLLEQMQDENRAILFSTHITSDLERVADYLTIIDNGKIKVSNTKDELLDSYRLIQTETLPSDLGGRILGLKQTAFGYSGLCPKDANLDSLGVKNVRPTIDDLLIHLREGGADLA